MTVLILAGTAEARGVAQHCHAQGIPCIASLAGATRRPAALPVPTRVGGFGGRDGFVEYLHTTGISRIIDATHPFAHQITTRTWDVAQALGLPYLRLERPAWERQIGEKWIRVPDEAVASGYIPPYANVFLATGRQSLGRFNLPDTCHVLCRQIDPPDTEFPFPKGRFVLGRPPFSVHDEIAIFQKYKVGILVVKNAGGAASRTKITAAGELGITTIVIDRPELPPMPTVETTQQAVKWLTT